MTWAFAQRSSRPMAQNVEAERSARSGALSLEHAAIRQIYRYLRPTDRPLKAETGT